MFSFLLTEHNLWWHGYRILNYGCVTQPRFGLKGAQRRQVRKTVELRMGVQNVADAIVFMATRSLDANALFLNIMATKNPFVGRG